MPDDLDPTDTTTEPEGTDDLSSLLTTIADQLSQLSDSESYPKGFEGGGSAFVATVGEFSSNEWIPRVLAVQGWLCLGDEIQDSAGPSDTAERLLSAIKPDGVDLLRLEHDAAMLTLEGAEELATRLERALSLREHFIECLDEGLSIAKATDAWRERWDEETDLEESPDPITAKVETWTIGSFKDTAVDNDLILNPSYQRADVWPLPNAQLLIASILKGIPLPSIIILKTEGPRSPYEVVDGKQRLTSILRFIGYHPAALRRVSDLDEEKGLEGQLSQLFHKDYKKFRRAWQKHTGEKLTSSTEAGYYFPFKLRSAKHLPPHLAHFGGKYYYEIIDEELELSGNVQTVFKTFERPSPSYKVPVIIYERATPRQIHEVFNLYNKQGKHLNAEEIRNARFHEIDLVRLLLVVAGDNANVDQLADYLTDGHRILATETGTFLSDFGFGTARYKRTKVAGWLTAVLFQPAFSQDTELAGIRSTAKHIDRLFDAIRNDPEHVLRRKEVLNLLVTDLHACFDAHSGADCWANKFKDNSKGKKWQELQLIASLIGTFLACVATENTADLLDEHATAIRAFTSANLRPGKTQNKDQWEFIARVSLGLLNLLGVDRSSLRSKLEERYAYSCLATLEEAAEL